MAEAPGPGFRYYSRRDLDRARKPDVPGTRYYQVALDKAMLTYFEVEPHREFPLHQHPSEQITLVLSGRLLFTLHDQGRHEIEVGPGEVIAIASDVPHAVRSLDEPVEAVDAWSPPRADFREDD